MVEIEIRTHKAQIGEVRIASGDIVAWAWKCPCGQRSRRRYLRIDNAYEAALRHVKQGRHISIELVTW